MTEIEHRQLYTILTKNDSQYIPSMCGFYFSVELFTIMIKIIAILF